MAKISFSEAQKLVNSYIEKGTKKDFKTPSGKLINGFLFTRKELHNLVVDGQNDYIFMMLALTEEQDHINLILGKHGIDDRIDTKKLLKPDEIVMDKKVVVQAALESTKTNVTSSLTVNTEKTILRIDNNISAPILEDLQKQYRELKPEDEPLFLDAAKSKKVKGYHLDREDVKQLGLTSPPSPSNENDSFLFLLVIRDRNPDESKIDHPYLSIAVSKLNSERLAGAYREYCLPCPPTCPKNFKDKL